MTLRVLDSHAHFFVTLAKAVLMEYHDIMGKNLLYVLYTKYNVL